MKQSKLRRASRYLVMVGILGIAIAGAMALVGMKPPPEKKESETLDLLVEVLPLTLTTAHFTVSSQGTVQPRTETVLSAELSGSIIRISDKFVAGGVFDKNDILGKRQEFESLSNALASQMADMLIRQMRFAH